MSVGDTRARTPETRAPKAATQQLRYLGPGQYQIPDWDAVKATAVAYYSSVIAYRCFNLIARTIAGCAFRAGPDPESKPDDFNPNAALTKLLGRPPGRPNPGWSSAKWWRYLIVQRLISGRMGSEIECPPGGDTPIALWPLVSAQLREIPSTGGTSFFSGFEYGHPSTPKSLRVDRCFYGYDPAADDPRQAESVLRAAHLDISVQVMLDRYWYGFFRNDARPSTVVAVNEFEDRDSYDAYVKQWNANFQGPENAGKVLVHEVTEGDGKAVLQVETVGAHPKDARQIEVGKEKREQIAIACGVPFSLLDASGRTFSNAGQEWVNFIHHTVMPLMVDLADEVNTQLAPRLGSEVGWFDTSRLNIEEFQSLDADGAAKLYDAQIITRNEARKPFGLPAADDGDALKKAPEPPPVMIPPPAKPTGELEPAVPAPNGNGHKAKPAIDVRSAVDDRERRALIWSATDRRVTQFERAWTRTFVRFFDRQKASVKARINSNRGRRALRQVPTQVGEVFDKAYWARETEDLTHDLYEAVVLAAGIAVVAEFAQPKRAAVDATIGFDVSNPEAQLFILARANKLAGQVTDTTYEAIKDALVEGVTEGEGIPQIAARVSDLTAFTEERATTIARTEVISAYNGSTDLMAAQLPAEVVAGREWVATDDDRTRPDHADADGQAVVVGEPFDVGGEAMAYPGDPNASPENIVNCRCTISLLTPDEMDTRSRSVSVGAARAVLGLIPADGGELDERAVRVALSEVA